ncbi:hypothetical protein [Tessaracoccus flavescens]|uniref:hypothetical protein n=1 Tax=Tessaracoccus flavescens TaxID=399497 RepID=UPI0012601407|nr:hypothetical protein [Tessaracoccus flavescens]
MRNFDEQNWGISVSAVNGKVVSEKVYKVIYVYTTGKVITIFPSSDQCTNANVGLTGPQPLSQPRENT